MRTFLKTVYRICSGLMVYVSMLAAQESTIVFEPINIFPDEQAVTSLPHWKMALSDSTVYSTIHFKDSAWSTAEIGIPWNIAGNGTGIRWYRSSLFIPTLLDSLQPLTIAMPPIVLASELYWDGRLIAANGTVSSAVDSEQSGHSAQIVIVPRELTQPGLHTLAIRASNHHARAGIFESLPLIGYFSPLQAYGRIRELMILMCAGIFLFTALFHFFMLWGRPGRLPYLLFGILCLASSAYLMIESLLRIFSIDLIWYFRLALINDIPWFAMMVLLPVFMLFEFSIRWRRPAAALIALIAAAIIIPSRLINLGALNTSLLGLFIVLNQIHIYIVTVFSLLIAVWAIAKRKTGGISATIGLLLLLTGITASYFLNIPHGWAIGFCGLILMLTISLALQMAWQNRMRQQIQLHNARLELELLKKHIQPHFLLNSLNSIIGYIEENPPVAAILVQALADELRMLMQYSKRFLISLDEELQLCKTHLKVMGLRQDKTYQLHIDGDISAESIPPMIIHTLVENGITHGYADKQQGSFIFTRSIDYQSVVYTLWNDSTVNEPSSSNPSSTGTGLNYVRSRLEEAFPGRWLMQSGPADNGWQVTITINRTS